MKSLRTAFDRRGPALYVLYGRRRLGKTALLQRFAEGLPGVYHMADRSTERDAIRLLAGSMALALNEPTLGTAEYAHWYALFAAFDRFRPRGKTFLILDEFQYLCEVQPAFSSILQKWWDENWSHTELMVVLCGSVVSMMYRETLARGSPLYGRRTGQWLMRPLGFRDAIRFFGGLNARSAVEMWALTGGVPRYGELCSGSKGFREALRNVVLTRDGPLYAEAKFLLQSEVTVSNVYWSLLHTMGGGATRVSEIAGRMGLPANQLTRYLGALRDMGLISRVLPVTDKNPAKSKKGVYQIVDPFLHLWFGCVAPFESLLEFGRVAEAEKLMENRLASHKSWAFEEICRQYLQRRAQEFGVSRVGSYWDRKTQIDVVGVDEKSYPRVAGECKWSARPIGMAILGQLKNKIQKVWPERAGNMRLMVFSGGGFSPGLRAVAESERIVLVDCEKLVEG